MIEIENPILKGFNPDPSIIRVDGDYYIATSTFEWFPGVQIHHSTDLKNWTLIARPLNRIAQLDMKGNPDSCGVWAPCLSYHKGTFYLVYSNVRSFDGVWKDTPNYLVTTKDITGDWSDPIFLSASGFDGSMFHEGNRKWFTSMLVDHRKGKFFGGIILQEYSNKKKKLVGPVFSIFEGTKLGKTEAPHIYKRNGYYYLITAEGGTEYGHAVSIARSTNITGLYELHPKNPFITARNNPKAYLQKAGHADLVETENGDWYAVFLVGRPLTERGRCTLGRETAIAAIEWKKDGWPYLKQGKKIPARSFSITGKETKKTKSTTKRIRFNTKALDAHFQSLRVPISTDWLSLSARPGFCRIYGRESLSSLHKQSLIARRVQAFHTSTSTCLDFNPTNMQELAGLVCYYNTGHWFYLHLYGHEDGKSKFLQILACDNYEIKEVLKKPIDLSNKKNVYLKADFNQAQLQFYYGTKDKHWIKVGKKQDGSILSDDYVRDGSERYRPAFTGAFVGICCQDLTGLKKHADFKWFDYQEL